MKTCSDCPFKTSSPLNGSPEWLTDVMRYHRQNKYFEHTCHKTDPKADGFAGKKKTIECRGHLQIMFNEMRGTPGRGGVYNSVNEMIEKYLRKWLGDETFEKMKKESTLKNLEHISVSR